MNRLTRAAVVVAMLAPAAVQAIPIIATPTDTVGPLRHNVFHDASRDDGVAGDVLAWFDLDSTMVSSWDPDTGALDLHVIVYDDSTLTTAVGTAHATSGDLLGAGFNDRDDLSLGFIEWEFDATATAFLGLAGSTVLMQFIDHWYGMDSAGRMANSYVDNTVTLWGADGDRLGPAGFENSTLGVDVVWVVPEPAVLVLFGLGLIGLALQRRRR